jgi:hypothetical protein
MKVVGLQDLTPCTPRVPIAPSPRSPLNNYLMLTPLISALIFCEADFL